MEKIAYCGLNCSKCPAYLATQADDDEARKKTAEFYKKSYGFNVSYQDINCDGCKAVDGRLFSYCQECTVKKCAEGKGIDNCAMCDEAPCDDLAKFHQFSPEAKASFEALRQNK